VDQVSVDEKTCVEQFRKVLETGRLGKAYRVVDGTGGDKVGKEGMSGEGTVCVMDGGRKKIQRVGVLRFSSLIFESYRRRGS
jgi:hypothetical protein